MQWFSNATRGAFFATMFAGSAFITWASLVYFEADSVAPFVIEKLPVRFASLWHFALKVHVATALFTLPACLLLMTRAVQRRRPLHRILGRITGILTVVALVPSGFILATEAKGGAWVSLGFVLSGALVLWFSIKGVQQVRSGQLSKHARSMRHVTAQMSVAVTSRAMLVLFDRAGFDPDFAYVVALWVPVLASALAAELLSGRTLSSSFRTSTLKFRSQP